MTWGLVPSWTKKEEKLDFFRMFNARSETVPEKTVFSRLLGSKRCVVLLNGFYEWAQVSVSITPSSELWTFRSQMVISGNYRP